jgi:putative ABC transport system permease protein
MRTALDICKMAFRNVARNVRRSLFTGAMVAIGVATIIFFRGYLVGLQEMIIDNLIKSRNGAFQVEQVGYGESLELAPLNLSLSTSSQIKPRLQQLANVEAITSRLYFVGLLSNGEDTTMFAGMGVEPHNELVVCPNGIASNRVIDSGGKAYGLVAGVGAGAGGEDGVLIGVEMAVALHLKVGDTVTLTVTTRSGSTDAVDVLVTGIHRYSDPFENQHNIVVSLSLAQKLLHMENQVTSYVAKVAQRAQIESAVAAAKNALGETQPPVEVLSWSDLSPYYRDVIILQDDLFSIALAVVILLALAGIINTMMMSVFERRREIGTLMSIGFRRHQILGLFLLESLVLGIVSALTGVAVGFLIVSATHWQGIDFNIPAVGNITVRPVWRFGFLAAAMGWTLIGALLAGVYPAYRASRLKPVDALRSD